MNWCHLFLHTAHTALCTSHFLKNIIIIQNLLWIYKLYIVWMLYSIKSSINSSLLFICFNNTLNHHQSYSFKNPLSSSSLQLKGFQQILMFDLLMLAWDWGEQGLCKEDWYLIPDTSRDHYVTGKPFLLFTWSWANLKCLSCIKNHCWGEWSRIFEDIGRIICLKLFPPSVSITPPPPEMIIQGFHNKVSL